MAIHERLNLRNRFIKLRNLPAEEYIFRYKDVERVKFVKPVDHGVNGIIHEANFNGQKVAVKELMPKSGGKAKELNTEIRILRCLSHENIIKFYRYISIPRPMNTQTLFAVLEFCPRSLKNIIEDSEVKKLVYSEKRDNVHQIVNRLDYLVKQSIIHCDLKPANILESENGRIKIADMGLSRKLIKERNFESRDYNVTTLWYRAPEVMRKTP
ncbi:CDK9 [Cordylochernes scorpioides]|uniref:CDK9 n=1 Tax=Cordylochernes scorpioides TaxID=51811 RepID=A0ABY6LKS3_9ARAC|nr:CDK9 [Cordylochernes scorpioides]